MDGDNTMVRAKWKLIALAVILLMAFAVWRSSHRVQPAASARAPTPAKAGSTNPTAVAESADHLDLMLRNARAAFEAAQDAGSKRQQVAGLREALSSMPTNDASRTIRRFLDSRADAGTGQGFK